MLQTNKLTIQFGREVLFEDVSLNTQYAYGIIGANSGINIFKSTSKRNEPNAGSVF